MIEMLVEPLSYPFMVRALITAVVVGVACAVLSCWLVLVGWSLMGDAVAHSVLPGVVLAYIAGLPFALGALVFGFGAVALISGIRETTRIRQDAAIGIVFTTLFAFGLVLISVTPSSVDLHHIVFGNLLGVSRADLIQILVLGVIVVAVALVKRRDLTLYAFDRAHAFALGLSPRALGALLLALMAITTVVALQAVGVILVVAMLIIPGATAHLLSDRMSHMLLIAAAIAVTCAVGAVYASFYADIATGGAVVLAQGMVFAVAYLFAPRHGAVARYRARGAL